MDPPGQGKEAGRPGLEPGLTEPKSAVLPITPSTSSRPGLSSCAGRLDSPTNLLQQRTHRTVPDLMHNEAYTRQALHKNECRMYWHFI